ncbi:hypothetical protein BpHYR1_046289 [Brachionus plicatilis]|uniref:Uncharacterized protein n=1 Tax=Brachionus plicatilis TaxID=10195 RepID=A0A3M7RYE3_BRAPC|nr:hypothetical protein BpHYR1_046289 [Brachionus plicatilis]
MSIFPNAKWPLGRPLILTASILGLIHLAASCLKCNVMLHYVCLIYVYIKDASMCWLERPIAPVVLLIEHCPIEKMFWGLDFQIMNFNDNLGHFHKSRHPLNNRLALGFFHRDLKWLCDASMCCLERPIAPVVLLIEHSPIEQMFWGVGFSNNDNRKFLAFFHNR